MFPCDGRGCSRQESGVDAVHLVDFFQKEIVVRLHKGGEGAPTLKMKADGGELIVEATKQVEDGSVVRDVPCP